MTFTNRIYGFIQGFGTPLLQDSVCLVAGTSLTAAAAVTSTPVITPAIESGYMRVKLYGFGGSGLTLIRLACFAQEKLTSPVNVVCLYDFNPTTALPLVASSPTLGTNVTQFDVSFPFQYDIPVTATSGVSTVIFSVQTTFATGTTASMDFEVAGVTGLA